MSSPGDHADARRDLARRSRYGRGRQMIVDRLGRIPSDPLIVDALRRLATDPESGTSRPIRELQELSQNELARLTGISQAPISAIENDRVKLGVERAKMLARALKCHPGVLVFPGWVVPTEAAA